MCLISKLSHCIFKVLPLSHKHSFLLSYLSLVIWALQIITLYFSSNLFEVLASCLIILKKYPCQIPNHDMVFDLICKLAVEKEIL